MRIELTKRNQTGVAGGVRTLGHRNHNPASGVRDRAFYFFRFQFTQAYAPTFPCYPPRLGTSLGTAICPHVWREGGL